MDFTKIKHQLTDSGHKVTLKYEAIGQEGGTEEHSVTCDEAPHPDFVSALQRLGPFVESACMIDVEEAEYLRVRSVTIKRNEGLRSVVITALREMDWISSPLVLNTPLAGELLVPEPEDAEESLSVLLNELETEARRYVEGKRAQQDLFEGDGAGVDSVTISHGGESVTFDRDDARRMREQGKR